MKVTQNPANKDMEGQRKGLEKRLESGKFNSKYRPSDPSDLQTFRPSDPSDPSDPDPFPAPRCRSFDPGN